MSADRPVLLVLSRSMPPDVGGYQRQMEILLPRFAHLGGHRITWVGAQRDPHDGAHGEIGAVSTLVRLSGFRVPRRVRGVVDLALLARAVPTLLAAALARRSRTLLLLSPGMLGGRAAVLLARRLGWRLVVRYPTSGDLTRARGARVAAVEGAHLVAPSQSQSWERSDVAVSWIPNAVQLPAVDGRASAASPDTGTLLFVGRLVERKRPLLVLRAWAEIANEVPGWQLVVVGEGADEPDSVEQEVRAFAAEHSLERCRFVGAVADARALMQEADLLVFPSVREGLPNTVIEAMAAGVPVIADPAHARRWFGRDVPLLPWSGDEGELSVALLEAISNPGVRKSAASAARRYVEDHHAPDAVARRYVDLFAEAPT